MSTATSRLGSRQYPHELGLGEIRGLEMQTPDGARGGRERFIVLDEIDIDAGLRQRPPVEGLGEIAPRIAEASWLDDANAGNGRFLDFEHGIWRILAAVSAFRELFEDRAEFRLDIGAGQRESDIGGQKADLVAAIIGRALEPV